MTKSGHLSHTSPILHSLSQVPSWEAINDGLTRMYGGEVISKFPVMQHVKFGSILRLQSKYLENHTQLQQPLQNSTTPTAKSNKFYINTTYNRKY
eukprot:UN05871